MSKRRRSGKKGKSLAKVSRENGEQRVRAILTSVGTGNGDNDDLLALESFVCLDLGGSTTSGTVSELRCPGDVREGGVGNLLAL